MPRLLVATVLAGMVAVANAAPMYVANNGTDSMYLIDTDAVSGTLIGSTGVDLYWGGLAFAVDGTLYGYASGDPNAPAASLYTVNQTSGRWTLVGPSGLTSGDSIDINPQTNKAYVPSLSPWGLYEIDLSTGLGTLVTGETVYFSGSAFAPDGTFYITNSPGNVAGPLFVLDVTGNGVTRIGILNIPEAITSLAFNPDDNFLYAVGTFSAHLWKIDPGNAVAADLGLISGVPTIGQYTMATIQLSAIPLPTAAWLFGSAMGCAGCFARRRKSR